MDIDRVIDRVTHGRFGWIERRFSVALVILILLNLVAMARLTAFNSLHVYAATNDVAGIDRMIRLGADVDAREHGRGAIPLCISRLVTIVRKPPRLSSGRVRTSMPRMNSSVTRHYIGLF